MRHLLPSVPEANAVPPVILERFRSAEIPLVDPRSTPQVTIATLIAQVDYLKAENHKLKQQVQELQASLEAVAFRLPIPELPPRSTIVFRRNAQGHYLRAHVWEIKESHAMVKFCTATLKWIALFSFGFALAMILAFGFNQMMLVEVLIQLAQNLWKPIAAVGLLCLAIAWFTEAV